MQSGKRKWIGIASLACIGAAGILFRTLWPRERLLLERATPVASTENWHLGDRWNCDIGIHWLSNGEILFNRFEGANQQDRVIYRRNIATGREWKLAALAKACNAFGAEVVDDQKVSPDGKWFLCSSRWGNCLLARMDGQWTYEYPSKDTADYRHLYWMADSRHWMESYVDGDTAHCLVLHDIHNPRVSFVLPLANKGQLYGSLEAVLSSQQAVAVLSPPHDFPADSRSNARVTVYRMSLAAGAKPYATYTVTAPHGIYHYDLCVSPRGDRIAWHVHMQRSTSLPAWLLHYLPFLNRRPQQTTELWVSQIDGRDRHEVGHITEPADPDNEDSPLQSVQWLPDEKHLSFEYKDTLYTVPGE